MTNGLRTSLLPLILILGVACGDKQNLPQTGPDVRKASAEADAGQTENRSAPQADVLSNAGQNGQTKPVEPQTSDPREVVSAAVTAAGGTELLKNKVGRYWAKGNMVVGDYNTPVLMHWSGPESTFMQLLNQNVAKAASKDQCWTRVRDVVLDCNAQEVLLSASIQKLSHWMSLYPLLDPAVRLTSRAPEKAGDQTLLVVSASSEQAGPSAEFLFDEKTRLLAKARFTTTVAGKPVPILMEVIENKTIDGVTLPVHTKITFGNVATMELTMTEVHLGEADDNLFKRPVVEVGVPKLHSLASRTVVSMTHKGPMENLGASIAALQTVIRDNQLMPVGAPFPALVFVSVPESDIAGAPGEIEIQYEIAPPGKPLTLANAQIKVLPETQVVTQVLTGSPAVVLKVFPELKNWAQQNGHKVVEQPFVILYSASNSKDDRNVIEVFLNVEKNK